MVQQFVQKCFNLFVTIILLLPMCLIFKCFETHHKIMYSNFLIIQYFLDCTCMALQSPRNAQWR